MAVVETTLKRIEQHDGPLNAFTAVTYARALARAKSIDLGRTQGKVGGSLAGVPFAVKNLFDVAGLPTLAGSKINRGRPPAERDSPLITRLEAAGAVLVGTLNMGEYAYDFTGENIHYGASCNPHATAHMAGGSSGGSGASVAGGLVPLSLGSDTNGSIRVPSSFCGLFGLKPTYGRLSRAGSFPFVASLDHLGPLARSTLDLALAYDAMQGYDPADPVCVDRAAEPVVPGLEHGSNGLRVAVAGGYFGRGMSAAAQEAVARIAAALGVSGEVEIPEAARARAAAYVITAAEGATLHLDRLRRHGADFDPAVRDRLIAGAMLPAPLVVRAQKFRRWYLTRCFDCLKVSMPFSRQPRRLRPRESDSKRCFSMVPSCPSDPILEFSRNPSRSSACLSSLYPCPCNRCRLACKLLRRHGAKTWLCASPTGWKKTALRWHRDRRDRWEHAN